MHNDLNLSEALALAGIVTEQKSPINPGTPFDDVDHAGWYVIETLRGTVVDGPFNSEADIPAEYRDKAGGEYSIQELTVQDIDDMWPDDVEEDITEDEDDFGIGEVIINNPDEPLTDDDLLEIIETNEIMTTDYFPHENTEDSIIVKFAPNTEEGYSSSDWNSMASYIQSEVIEQCGGTKGAITFHNVDVMKEDEDLEEEVITEGITLDGKLKAIVKRYNLPEDAYHWMDNAVEGACEEFAENLSMAINYNAPDDQKIKNSTQLEIQEEINDLLLSRHYK